jgi:hypothetical protein
MVQLIIDVATGFPSGVLPCDLGATMVDLAKVSLQTAKIALA